MKGQPESFQGVEDEDGTEPEYGKGYQLDRCVKAGRVLRAGTARFEPGRPGGPMPAARHPSHIGQRPDTGTRRYFACRPRSIVLIRDTDRYTAK